ncbi:MAG: response regulator transcription factor [Deferrisomatales bacterium]
MRAAQILVAEDDGHIRQGLVDSLESEGYAVVAVGDGAAALAAFRAGPPDLVLLDIMMPERSGYDVCREIRRDDPRTPILMLTAKGEEIDKVVGLELGADDYITKPFGVRELLARVAAALRRSRQGAAPRAVPERLPQSFRLGPAEVDRKRYEVRLGERASRVTPREMELLELFFQHPGAVLSRDRLLNALWGVDYEGTTRTLDQHVAQLRKKVEPEPATPRVIVTVHGVGYRYEG